MAGVRRYVEGGMWQGQGGRRQAESGKGQDAGLNNHWQVQLSTMASAAVAVAGQLVELVMGGL